MADKRSSTVPNKHTTAGKDAAATHVHRLEQRIEDLAKQLQAGTLRTLMEEAVKGASQKLAADRQEAVNAVRLEASEQAQKAIETVSQAHRLGLNDLQAALSTLRDDVDVARMKATAVDERVAEPHLNQLVATATEATATGLFTEKFQRQIQALETAYERADDRFEELRTYIDAFGPGGLPVLTQERDALRERLEHVESDLARHQAELSKSRERVAELDAQRLRHMMDDGLDPKVLERRLSEIDTRSTQVSEREALSAENLRLRKKLDDLTAELERLRAEDAERVEARASHREVQRLRQERDEADEARQKAESTNDRDLRRLRVVQGELEKTERKLAEHKTDMAAVEQRERLNQELTALVESQKQELDTARAKLATLASLYEQTCTQVETQQRQLEKAEQRFRHAATEWRAEQATGQRQWETAKAAELRAIAQQEVSTEVSRLLEVEKRYKHAQDQEQSRQTDLAHAQRCVEVAEAAVVRAETSAYERMALYKQELDLEREALLKRTRDQAEAEVQPLRDEASKLRKQVDADRSATRTLADEVSTMLGQKGALTAELSALRAQVDALRPKTVEDDERMASLTAPWFPAEQLSSPDSPNESDWLQSVSQGIEKAGFIFHDRLIHAFHTSLKIAEYAPLTVLAGISGTGKSELPRLYADLGGLPFMELAVQPSWDSPQDLFGFFNYTDGRVKAEPLARLLQQVGNDNDPLRDSPALVLLDEMNLARVEYYFADLLSKLESRRGVDRFRGAADRQRASVLLDTGPGRPPHELFVDPRLMFIGTMNEDESTLGLSDKVIDRASMLTFPAPKDMRFTATGSAARREQRLSWSAWRDWIEAPTEDADQDWLNEINVHMSDLGRPFGHRVFRAIHAYLSNYPTLNGDPEQARKNARSDQWAMKIIPRLRGLECDDRMVRTGLDALASQVPDELQDAFKRARDREFFAWAGAAEMYRSDA